MHLNLISFIQGDSLQGHNGMKFTTKDKDNDTAVKNCAVLAKGDWWFNGCMSCDLNGPYHKSAVKSTIVVGWSSFGREWISLKSARMMIRSKAWCLNLYGN